MKTWTVWMEGYSATGESAGAHCVGTVEAETLPDAAEKLFADSKWAGYEFNRERMTYWGCKIFDNEADARKSFG
jgi:hypothetical protein